MGIDLDRVATEPLLIAGGVLALLLVKFSILFFVGRLWPGRLPPREALALGGVLWLGGEFAFVVLHEAKRVRLIESVVQDRLVEMAGISMEITRMLLLGTPPPHRGKQPQHGYNTRHAL